MTVLRPHLALTVSDVERSIPFYEALFGVSAEKRRPGYARFSIAEPALNFTLRQGQRTETLGALDHAGIQVAGTDDVLAARLRLQKAGLVTFDELDTTCCYARQDKFWVTGAPGGEHWEIYTVLADSSTFWGQDGEQRWDAVQAELDAPAAQATQCCGGPQATDGLEESASSGVCCT